MTCSTECIEWQGCRLPEGYGQHQARPHRGKLAHRVAWESAFGPIPEGMYVCHHCDNPPCINIDHLFLGTATDNNIDCNTKDRRNQIRGETHHKARLTEDDVRAIRAVPRYHGVLRDLAAEYGVSDANISHIRRRKSWRHVA